MKSYVAVEPVGHAWSIVLVTAGAKTIIAHRIDRGEAVAYGEQVALETEQPFRRDA